MRKKRCWKAWKGEQKSFNTAQSDADENKTEKRDEEKNNQPRDSVLSDWTGTLQAMSALSFLLRCSVSNTRTVLLSRAYHKWHSRISRLTRMRKSFWMPNASADKNELTSIMHAARPDMISQNDFAIWRQILYQPVTFPDHYSLWKSFLE